MRWSSMASRSRCPCKWVSKVPAVQVPNDAIDSVRFRNVLGNFPTSVVAVTAGTAEGTPEAMVVGSFTSVSLDPPLVSFLADNTSTTLPKILAAGRYCANVLAGDQEAMCRRMARRGADRFSGVDWQPSPLGNPILSGSVAWVDCEIDQVVQLGDHTLVVGRVRELEVVSDKTPLVFFRGGYGDYYSPAAVILDRLMNP